MVKSRKKYIKKLMNRYRIVVLNDQNLEKKVSFALTPFNVLTLFSMSFFLMFMFVFAMIAFSPLKEYMPGYTNIQFDNQIVTLFSKTDSLQHKLHLSEQYLDNIRRIINDEIEIEDREAYAEQETEVAQEQINLFRQYRHDSILRAEIENVDNFSLLYNPANRRRIDSYTFLSPVRGIVSQKFNAAAGHFAVDIVTRPNEGIKAVLDGTVVFAEWSASTGHVIVLQHPDNYLSVYKHNSVLLKKVGNFVRAGEVISIVGNSGELTTGPHLHFELWQNGKPLDPEKFMIF